MIHDSSFYQTRAIKCAQFCEYSQSKALETIYTMGEINSGQVFNTLFIKLRYKIRDNEVGVGNMFNSEYPFENVCVFD